MRLGLTEKCRRSSEARLGSDVTGVRVPAPTNWTETGERENWGPNGYQYFIKMGTQIFPILGINQVNV